MTTTEVNNIGKVYLIAEDMANKKAFFEALDSQHLTFQTYMYAVMGKFQCDAAMAGLMIGKHYNGIY